MAKQRRMFSNQITASDAFLDMPSESQLLYFHLGMNADDDGFISNAKMVQRVLGASDDALKILLAKKFIIPFDTGICVIKHWRINNQLRKDRYNETKYLDEKSLLFIRENGAYTTNPENAIEVPRGHFLTLSDTGIPNGNQMATNGKPSIGKVSIGKVREVKNTVKKDLYSDERFVFFWNEYPNKVGKGKAWESWIKLQPSNELARKIVQAVRKYKTTTSWKKDNGQFIPHASTFLNQRRFDDDIENITSGSVTEF